MTIKRIKIDLNIINAHFDLEKCSMISHIHHTKQNLISLDKDFQWGNNILNNILNSTIISCSLSDKCKQLLG